MKRPTQTDVAHVAGVSRATVSYVLNGQAKGRVPISEETRKRVLAAVEELGYEPDARAQALRSGSTQTIGLILPDIRTGRRHCSVRRNRPVYGVVYARLMPREVPVHDSCVGFVS